MFVFHLKKQMPSSFLRPYGALLACLSDEGS